MNGGDIFIGRQVQDDPARDEVEIGVEGMRIIQLDSNRHDERQAWCARSGEDIFSNVKAVLP